MPRKSIPAKYCDFGTPELRKKRKVHIGYVSDHQQVVRVKDSCLLEFYYNREYIDNRQYNAGSEFALLWHICNKEPSITSRYMEAQGGILTREELYLYQQDAEVKYNEALAVLGYYQGPIAKIALDVCIFEQKANSTNRRGMHYLREGLDLLGDHWGL